jgi:Family of unknown function (DUF6065)
MWSGQFARPDHLSIPANRTSRSQRVEGNTMQHTVRPDTASNEQFDHGTPIASFYRFVPECRLPMRADRAAAGTMPTRAFRYCEAMTSASAFGWYVFPPITFSLMWDGGSQVLWTFKGQDAWFPLGKAQFPGFADHFDKIAPAEFRGFSPPFLAAFKEPGVVQIWSGLFARTAPGWSLLIRPPANLARSQGYENYEGIVETDHWFGPLFSNVRLTRTNVPVEFDEEYPFLQVQPVHRSVYGQALDRFEVVGDVGQLESHDWGAFRATVVQPNVDQQRQLGQYAVSARRRQKRAAESAIAETEMPASVPRLADAKRCPMHSEAV